jgi:hypothetical protein
VILFMPAVDHTIEYALHYANGTKKLAASIAASVSLSMLSSVFNLFAMRRGVLIVGDERASLIDDLRRLPRVIFDFVMTIPRTLRRIRICHRDTETQRKAKKIKRSALFPFAFSVALWLCGSVA